MGTDDHGVDDRLRTAWRDRHDGDHQLDVVPPSSWSAIAAATDDAAPPAAGRRGWRWPLVVGIGAVVAVALLAIVVWPRPSTTVAAEAELTAAPADGPAGANGTAMLIDRDDGRWTLDVTLRGIPSLAADQAIEIWLFDTDRDDIQSLGLVEGDRGSVAVPMNLDVGRYDTVDVSVEPIDGDPTHSGNSLVRGELAPR